MDRSCININLTIITFIIVLTASLTSSVHGQASAAGAVSENNILVLNRGIIVPLGRSVALSQDDLRINVNPGGDRCVVTVLATDALAQRPGKLMPNSFPCEFGPQDVVYSHFGARNPPMDVIRLQIRYDTPSETILIPLTIHVEVSFMQLEIITRNLPITVEKLQGVSTPIDDAHLEFNFAEGVEECKITVLPQASGLPRYGVVMNDSSILQMVDCEDFLKMGVRYKHTAPTNSPDKDYIPLVVEIMDPEGRVSKREYFQILVRILEGAENVRPSPDFNAELRMEVNQFVMTAITPNVLAAEDKETPADLIVFNITKPLRPGEGVFVSTDDRRQTLSSFFQSDIRDLKIAYKPPPEDSDQKRVYFVEFVAMDSDGDVSDPFVLMIEVKPMNTLAPVVTKNSGIQLFEGQSRSLNIDSNLQISDENNLDDVKVVVADGLRNGQLLIPEKRNFFTAKDLATGAIIYQHDDSDTDTDNIIFQMDDGQNVVDFLFPIWIFPEDDEPPILNVNTGLEILKNDLVEITPLSLSATDSDSDDLSIKFVIQPPYSDEGIILMRQYQAPENPDEWQFINGVYEKIVDEFTQSDILDGKIYYQHIGPHRSDFILDRIKFTIEDTAEPPNRSDMKEYAVRIEPIDDQLPYLYPNTSLQLEVDEFQMTEFRRKFLRYTDDDTVDREIKFHVTSPPFDTDSNTPLDAGIITLCEDPDIALASFTQAQVNHRKMCYKPPQEDLGIVPRIIQFIYDVGDTNGNVLRDERFTIFLRPMDNQPPEIKNGGVDVFEGGLTVLTSDMLAVNDPDTEEENLMFVVMEIPKYGQIQMKEEKLDIGDFFTPHDIKEGNIVYINNGDEVGDDKFMIDVSDGVHHVPVNFKVNIENVDDEKPALVGVRSEILKVVLEVQENSVVGLSSNDIKATDPDSDDMKLKFFLERAPFEGVILKGVAETTEFTQGDIIAGLVMYQHTGGEVGLKGKEDFFELTLQEPDKDYIVDGSKIEKILVEVKILPFDNEPPVVVVDAPFEVLESEKAPILPRHIDTTDIDTKDDDIMCLIISQPVKGYLESIMPSAGSEKSRVGIPVSSFLIKDIRDGNVNYVQSVHKGIEPRQDSFMFHCSDGINQSPDFRFDIEIFPSNDEEPVISLREFIVVEGGNLRIDLPILNVVDKDDPSDKLTFVITEKPKHGKIVRQTALGSFVIQNFTLDDISHASTIEYEHDDSETTQDMFSFYLVDGIHNMSRTVPIKVFPLDDETPRLTINTGLQIDTAGETKAITNEILKAEDLDSSDPDLRYFVRLKPKHGYLRKIDGQSIVNITQGANFTQRDIDKKKIEYVHFGIEGVRDLIKFDITDGLNSLIDRYFYVNVEGLDMIFPRVINKGVELPEGGMAVLTTDLLSGTDLNTPDEKLTFIVTRAPANGHLESSDMPGVPITTFNQLQLAGNKIRYVHDNDNEMKMDSFEFEVTDGFNPVTRTFRISLSDVDNRKPVLMFQTLRLKEGDNKLITPFELKAEDSDTHAKKIVFTITQVPIHGLMLYNISRVISSFTMNDLNKNMISYQHDGSETTKDSFSFTVTDGTHTDFFVFPETSITTRRPQTVDIEIVPVDNGIPQININRGASYLSQLADSHLGFRISNRILSTEDRDSPDDNLKYRLTSQPKFGYIINRAIGNKSISNWTQGDINRQQIEYVLTPGVNATMDTFYFTISDNGGNVLANQPFRLNWAWISLQSDVITVNETDKVLNVTLRRRGYLGETAFVTVTAMNGSARVGEDFTSRYARQVQFNPGQTEKTWRLRLVDDKKFENAETFELKLSDPVTAVLEYPDVARVTIDDLEDESQVFFSDDIVEVSENIGEILIPIKRIGDVSEETVVICSTAQDTATGTVPSTVTSFSDYISRYADHRSMVRFDRGEQEQFCRVTIIDDSLYEEAEKFAVVLSQPMGGKLGKIRESTIVILPDKSDEPTLYLGSPEYIVDESDGPIEVKVWRTGTDLSKPSNVTIRSSKSDPKSASAGRDYVPLNTLLVFAPGVTMQTVRVVVLDDVGRPRLEGEETFLLRLRLPVNAMLGEPKTAVVRINDSISDLPSMQFKEAMYKVSEEDGEVRALILRSGDINHPSSVRCYTRQDTARVADDYEERPNTNDSIVMFEPGEYVKECKVKIVDDVMYEDSEQFRLVLGSPDSSTLGAAKVGNQDYTMITIEDQGDEPVIKLSATKYTVKEPMFKEETSVLKIPVVREGDLSQTAVVTVNTKDGSADAGKDYHGFFRELVFESDVSKVDVDVEILFDGQKEMREVFTVHLKSLSGTAKIENQKAIVFIEERQKVADVTFPSRPMVVSLREYDTAEDADTRPVQGYPLVCITACNPKHPHFLKTGALCETEGVNDTLTLFRWRVSAPTGQDGVTSSLRDVESNTYFASTRTITLDSIYFSGGSRVQCGARAYNLEGEPGRELMSEIITVNPEAGICEPRVMDSVGAEPFTSKMRYTGSSDPRHPNKIRLTITIPHRDGMMPVISTRRLSNFELTLSKDGTRLASHRCSNLLDYQEINTEFGFLTNETKNPAVIGEAEPYQYSPAMRSEPTLRFYKNLNLESCLWVFETYYDMSELMSDCGGTISTDGQVLNMKQSYVSMTVPLYVSYVFHSPVARGGWLHYDMTSQLQLTFVYDTSILWQSGITNPEGESGLQGYMYPTSMRIRDDGRLVVAFRTEARFRGQFVAAHPGSSVESMVMSQDHPDLTFSLDLVRSDATLDQPNQEWSFVSDFSVRDYSGDYHVKLIPCTSSLDQEFTQPISCSPREPLTFDLPIRFQQVSDPVPAEFSLDTNFHLMRKKQIWLSEATNGFEDETDVAFLATDRIYGRIDVDPVQNLGNSFDLNIEKIFLCSGKDGYIPKYDPDNREFGCVAESPFLQYTFKILDKGAPFTVEEEFRDIPFKATLAVDDPDALDLVRQPGSDGFSLDCQPIFQVDSGRQWFLHAIYTIRSKANSGRGIGKRSAGDDPLHHAVMTYSGSSSSSSSSSSSMEAAALAISGPRQKRSEQDVSDVGRDGKGTNIARIQMDAMTNNGAGDDGGDVILDTSKKSTTEIPLIPIIISLIVIFIVGIIIIICIAVRRRRKSSSPPPSPTNTITVVRNGNSSVVTRNHHYSDDRTEV